MTLATIIAVFVLCLGLLLLMLLNSKKHLKKTQDRIHRIKSLEQALADPEVVAIVQKLIRDPWIRDPKTAFQKRKNARHALLRAQLKERVPDEATRKMIYTFIWSKKRFY